MDKGFSKVRPNIRTTFNKKDDSQYIPTVLQAERAAKMILPDVLGRNMRLLTYGLCGRNRISVSHRTGFLVQSKGFSLKPIVVVVMSTPKPRPHAAQ